MRAEELARAIDIDAKKTGQEWSVRCPAHSDSKPSLNITEKDGMTLFICRAGCTQDAVLAQLKRMGLWTTDQHLQDRWRRAQRDKERRWAMLIQEMAKNRDNLREEDQRTVDRANQILATPDVALSDYMPWAASLPPPEFLCGPWQTHSSGFIAAPGGSGKSMFSMGLARAMASGEPFCGWETEKPLKVYMVDVEMSDPGLLGRMRALSFDPGLPIRIDTSGRRDELGLSRFQLGDYDSMYGLMESAEYADVVMIDNVSACLKPHKAGDLFSPETWQQVFSLESWARREGKLLIFIDHTNKGGQLAGSLHKHRMADFVCLMERESLIGEPWLEFTFWLDKARYDVEPDDAMARMIRLQDGKWSHSDPEENDNEILHEVVMGNMTKKEAAEELGVSRPTVDKRLKKYKLVLHARQRKRSEK